MRGEAIPVTERQTGEIGATHERLRAESDELVRILTGADLDSVAGIKELGGYVARLAQLVRDLTYRTTSGTETSESS